MSQPVLDMYVSLPGRWVLSAGHCFCINNPCKKNAEGDTVVDYTPKERVMMVTGTRDLKIIQRLATSIRDRDNTG